mmetsp:Transcript_11549/g.40385  ORF Transcript_11549/g.40385 Transcript_11549/m.40385 type:complete len:225 (+) Transcript_11549:1673-2347(+)
MSVHGRAADGVEALQLAADVAVVAEDAGVEEDCRHDGDREPGRLEDDASKGADNEEEHEHHPLEVLWQQRVNGVHILGEARQHAAHGRRVEEAHRRAKHALHQAVVQAHARLDAEPHEQVRAHVCHEAQDAGEDGVAAHPVLDGVLDVRGVVRPERDPQRRVQAGDLRDGVEQQRQHRKGEAAHAQVRPPHVEADRARAALLGLHQVLAIPLARDRQGARLGAG